MASFFAPEIDLDTKNYTLSEEESKHCVRVLRKRVGDELELLNGKGVQLLARISDDNPKKCKVEIYQSTLFPKAEKEVHIAVAPTKNA
jgi:16S rRNA (uracil1498-N3)-methyltransferase